MTFPRSCLYALLAACLLLPGCVANQYAIKINAITNGDIQAGIGVFPKRQPGRRFCPAENRKKLEYKPWKKR